MKPNYLVIEYIWSTNFSITIFFFFQNLNLTLIRNINITKYNRKIKIDEHK